MHNTRLCICETFSNHPPWRNSNCEGPVYKERGLPCARVTLASGSGVQAIFTGRVTLSPGSTLPALLACFVMHDILCNGPKFEIILKFSVQNT